jgi:hypothetical protein
VETGPQLARKVREKDPIMMKKILVSGLTALMLIAFVPVQGAAFSDTNKAPVSDTNTLIMRQQVLIERLDEIKEMDKSELTRSEKKELRNEVREIKQEIRGSNRGVFISVGSLVLIAILLILLL